MRVIALLSAFVFAAGLTIALPAAPAFADGIERPKVIKKQPRRPAPKRPRPPEVIPAPAPPPPVFIPSDADDGLKLPDSFFAGGGGVGLDITGGPGYGGFVVVSGPEERFSGIGPLVPGIAQTFNPPRPMHRPRGM